MGHIAGRKPLSLGGRIVKTWELHCMMVVPIVIVLIFCYIPMVGLSISFQQYYPTKGFFNSKWVGLAHYRFLFSLEDTWNVIRNTLVISVGKILVGISFSVVFALLLNEISRKRLRVFIQTMVFFPFFLSWVVLGGILVDILSLKGMVNAVTSLVGIDPVMFLGNAKLFVPTIIITNTWKDFGYNMIIFYAAIMNVDSTLYEAAVIDGAGRIRQTFAVTLPSIAPVIAVVTLLALGGVLNAGFDQIFNMYNPLVYETGDILDTYIYRMGLLGAQYSFATAIGLFKSLIGFTLILFSYWAMDRFANYRII